MMLIDGCDDNEPMPSGGLNRLNVSSAFEHHHEEDEYYDNE